MRMGAASRDGWALGPAPPSKTADGLRRRGEPRHDGSAKGLGPDSKSQVTLRYEDGKPVKATSVVISTQHDATLGQEEVRGIVMPFIRETLPDGWLDGDTVYYINPTGRFVIGGDRKSVV